MIEATHLPWVKAIIAALWLTGARVSELLRLRRRNVKVVEEEGYIVFEIPTLKKRRRRHAVYETPTRKLFIPIDAPFMDELLSYIEGKAPDELLWPRSRQIVWRRIKEVNPLASPHLFRHDRLQHLADRGASMLQLQAWAGWSDARPAGEYIRLSGQLTKPLMDKLLD